MNQTPSSRIPAPTDEPTRRNLRLLVIALVGGLIAVFLLRQEWAKEQIWPWALLVGAMVTGGLALRRLELWLPGEPILPRLATFPKPNRRWAGLVCLLSALLLTGMLIWRLWPDYRQWQGSPVIWLSAMVLAILGAWLLGAVGRGSPRAATGLNSGRTQNETAGWKQSSLC